MASHCGMHVPQPNGASGVKSIISHILAHGAKSSAGSEGERDSKGTRHQAAMAGRPSKEAQGGKAAAEGKRREPSPGRRRRRVDARQPRLSNSNKHYRPRSLVIVRCCFLSHFWPAGERAPNACSFAAASRHSGQLRPDVAKLGLTARCFQEGTPASCIPSLRGMRKTACIWSSSVKRFRLHPQALGNKHCAFAPTSWTAARQSTSARHTWNCPSHC